MHRAARSGAFTQPLQEERQKATALSRRQLRPIFEPERSMFKRTYAQAGGIRCEVVRSIQRMDTRHFVLVPKHICAEILSSSWSNIFRSPTRKTADLI
jgi:hypothetical protein